MWHAHAVPPSNSQKRSDYYTVHRPLIITGQQSQTCRNQWENTWTYIPLSPRLSPSAYRWQRPCPLRSLPASHTHLWIREKVVVLSLCIDLVSCIGCWKWIFMWGSAVAQCWQVSILFLWQPLMNGALITSTLHREHMLCWACQIAALVAFFCWCFILKERDGSQGGYKGRFAHRRAWMTF